MSDHDDLTLVVMVGEQESRWRVYHAVHAAAILRKYYSSTTNAKLVSTVERIHRMPPCDSVAVTEYLADAPTI
jgi:hypothetical protein